MTSDQSGQGSRAELTERRHDAVTVATLFARKMASRERHVCFLLGAGASKAAGLPDMAGLKTAISSKLASHGRGDINPSIDATDASTPNMPFPPDFSPTDADSLGEILSDRTVEEALTWLRKASALLEGESDTIGGLTKARASLLDVTLSSLVMATIQEAQPSAEPFSSFAKWLRSTSYSRPVEVFTLNYDLLLESALEKVGMPYFDGFTGVYEGRFRADLVEPSDSSDALPTYFHRVWKMHGSVSWTRNDEGVIVRKGGQLRGRDIAAIHPSESKYEDSRRAPFVILQDRLRRALFEPETILVIAGYSFGDQHINEVILDAIRARPRSEFVFTHFGEIPDEAQRAAENWRNVTLLGPNYGVVGGDMGIWTAPEADAKAQNIWSDGAFQLGNFQRLAEFLARSVPPEATAAVNPSLDA